MIHFHSGQESLYGTNFGLRLTVLGPDQFLRRRSFHLIVWWFGKAYTFYTAKRTNVSW